MFRPPRTPQQHGTDEIKGGHQFGPHESPRTPQQYATDEFKGAFN